MFEESEKVSGRGVGVVSVRGSESVGERVQ